MAFDPTSASEGIRSARIRNGESVEDAARALGVDKADVLAFEQSETVGEMPLSAARILANHYGCSIDVMVGRDG